MNMHKGIYNGSRLSPTEASNLFQANNIQIPASMHYSRKHFYPAVRTGSSNTLFFYYPAVRTGSSNTHFFSVVFFFIFFGGHLPQTSGFRSAKQILVVSFATQARAFILIDRSIFYTHGG